MSATLRNLSLPIVLLLCSTQFAAAGLIHDFSIMTDDGNVDLVGTLTFQVEVAGAFTQADAALAFTGGTIWGVLADFLPAPNPLAFSGEVDGTTWQIEDFQVSAEWEYTTGAGTREFNIFSDEEFASECVDIAQLQRCDGLDENMTGTATVEIAYRQVPEPASLALMGLGLAGVGFSRRKTS